MPATSRFTLRSRLGRGILTALVVAVPAVVGACGDDPFQINWVSSPDTVLIYSLARPELNLAAGFDFHDGELVRVEGPQSTGSWDLAVDTRGGEMVFLPPGALGVSSRARITTLPGMSFLEVTEAPSDTLVYVADEAVPIRMGTIYVVRTGRSAGVFSSSCVYYAKLEPLVIDPEGGTLSFVFEDSPVCNSLRLIPPD